MRIHSDIPLDNIPINYACDSFSKGLKQSFPEISKSNLNKNKQFYFLLNDYKGYDINGIKSFLDERGFDLVSIRLNIGELNLFNLIKESEKEDIISGKLLLGGKIFFYNNDGNRERMDYLILATKKDNPIYSNLKVFFQDLFSQVLLTKTN